MANILSFSVDVRENEEERIDCANIASQQFKAAGVEMKVNIVQKLDWNSLRILPNRSSCSI